MDDTSFIPMDDKHLGQFAENTARALHPMGRMTGRGVCRSTLAALDGIRRVRDGLVAEKPEETGAGTWLLDNWYLVQREGAEGAQAFRRAKRLRYVLRDGRRCLVMELARAFVRAAGSDASPERLAIFLDGAQAGLPLTETELSLVVPALKCALTERLDRLCAELEHMGEDGADSLCSGMEAAFTALRTLSQAELSALLEGASRVEAALRQDPAGQYPLMSDDTRARYRAQVCRLARKTGLSESDAAQRVLDAARRGSGAERHVGCHLFPRGGHRVPEAVYVGAVVLATMFITLLVSYRLDAVWAAFLLLLPVSDIVKNCADFLAVHLVRPRNIHRMELEHGIPEEGRTLCVIASLLTDRNSGGELAALLERYRLANRDAGAELKLGLLADLPDRARPMGEQEKGWVDAACAAIDGLNAKYGGGFFLFFREPVYHAPDERYMGWERKRGALVELCRLLRRQRSGLRVYAGEAAELTGIKYVLTLDSDTALSVGAARAMAGAMLHPLNRPEVDPVNRVVVNGYGLLQPRVAVDLESANRSQFSRIFAGQGGVDPYASASSDVYHDLFDEGTYTGKGIFDVDTFLTCLDRRIPQNTVLSHDLLEGSYLHAGLIGDVELTDGYPYKVTSYFSRLHRWVRGDWQLLPWLRRSVKNESGQREPNPLGGVARWKILDNLRRSLSPVSTMLALLLGMCLSGGVFTAAAGIAVLSCASNLLLSGADLAFRSGRGLGERYHSTIIAGFGGFLLQTLVQLLFLPYHAWISLSAALTALWRLAVSHRGLLAWTTAAEAERRGKESLAAYYRAMGSAAAVGIFALLFSKFPLGAAAGLVWLFAPLFAWLMSRPIQSHRTVPEEDQTFLLHQAHLIWGYFADFLRPQDHYLPPDNDQEQPAVGLARRTSPTNIGMALLCCVAAADLGLIPKNRALSLLGHMTDTLERLSKWNGHLYNWYGTADLVPLEPRYVSTVDSGNLCGCLLTLREALLEWGEPGLARRVDALAACMDFSLLYDAQRRLFTIGYDCVKDRPTEGWYDLMASEARQTSYLAVARGEVPQRHWRRLSRALVGEDHYRGMASWTGTMFEYFMPHLLLPAYQNSLLYESLTFCVYAQKKRVKGTGAPWGISESCFYAFGGELDYQYKAHGVQRLGLKRGLDRELVVSPYSTFLTLPLVPRSAVRNLRRLAELGLEGPYGLYEAADFTPSRVGAAPFEPVRSYMAHHLGMSLVAIDNALKGGIMQERFMRDAAMSAYRELLQEKVPVGARVMRTPRREVPDKPGRQTDPAFCRSGEGYDGKRPECHLLSGGAWRVLCTDAGAARSRMGRTDLTRCIWDRPGAPAGVSFFLKTESELLSLTPAPLYQRGPGYRWQFQDDRAAWRMSSGGFTSETRLILPRRADGELRETTLTWTGEGEQKGELICYLEPVLAALEDYEAHPAFSKLSLESEALGDGILFTRRARRVYENRPALCVAWDAGAASWDTSREAALGRGGLRALEYALTRPAGQTAGAVLDPCLLVRFPLALRAGRPVTVRLALSAADHAGQAVAGARGLLRLSTGAEDHSAGTLLRELELTGGDAGAAFELLRRLQFPSKSWVRRGSEEQAALWPFGISGDLPILAFRVEDAEHVREGERLLRIHQFLTRSGFAFDLALLLAEGGDYRHPLRETLEGTLRDTGWEHRLGSRGGVFLIECADQTRAEPILRAAIMPDAPDPGRRPIQMLPPAVPPNGTLSSALEEDGAFRFETGAALPPVGWSIVLANGFFGWRTDETGGGHLWYGNAKENPLTDWRNDPLAVGGPERLVFRRGGEEVSFFSDLDGVPCTVTYRAGTARWEKRWKNAVLGCSAFVPAGEPARYLLLSVSEGDGEAVYQQEGGPEQHYALRGSVCLRTAPGPDGRTAETRALADVAAVRALERETLAWWAGRVSALRFCTPEPALDAYLNGWALYQVMACRLFARTSLYQNGGAYGFRDQLQDVCALLFTAPELTRAQILTACAHQYLEGDVQHWWHPAPEGGTERGVRTRISDDLLWLPYTLCEYIEKTGRRELLEERAPFLVSRPLEEKERERFEAPQVSSGTETVMEHAVRAIECALQRGRGSHGLALMGTGDWNDGMDLVGAGGVGESVWLTWFLSLVLERFAPLCPPEQAGRYRILAGEYAAAANAAWDGEWFLRGWYDDGQTLGSHADAECRIDSVAQSFAALCPGADREKALTGVRSALVQLFDRGHGLVKLFTPPFDGGTQDPGYIRGYLPGVRENGGQYTHAAVWLALAALRLGMAEEGYEVLKALMPANHPLETYKAEPFVLSADVYANPSHTGRGGWSWYTGAAGWYYRTAVEAFLGLQVRDGLLYLAPNLPKGWDGFSAEWTRPDGRLKLRVERTGKQGLTLDGRPHEGGVPLTGEHTAVFSF